MKCIVLAAGYATRLYPLTENFPKPLLNVGDKTILDWLLDDMEASGKVNGYAVVSNHRFAHIFEDWAKTKPFHIDVIDDGTVSNETRLGAVKDILFAVRKLSIKEDVIVVAGDNVLDFSLSLFIDYALSKGCSCVMRFFVENETILKKSGVLCVDENDRVLKMSEKPSKPESNWCCPPFYYYTAEDIGRLEEALESGCGYDAPGSFAAWVSENSKLFAMEMPGKRYDIGDLASYENVQSEFRGICNEN